MSVSAWMDRFSASDHRGVAVPHGDLAAQALQIPNGLEGLPKVPARLHLFHGIGNRIEPDLNVLPDPAADSATNGP